MDQIETMIYFVESKEGVFVPVRFQPMNEADFEIYNWLYKCFQNVTLSAFDFFDI